MSQTFDVIIIGAGIMGCSAAFQLAQRGLKVALLEKSSLGSGPSGKSSAIIRQHYSNRLTARMARYSLSVFQNFNEQVGGECGFTRTGFMAIAAAKDQAGLEANVTLQREVGIQTELLSAETLREIMPGLETADLVTAAYEPESGYAEPYLTVNAYANAARRVGVKIFQETEVINIRFAGGKVMGVETSKDSFDAPLLLACSGPWTAHLGKMAGFDLPIKPCRVQVSLFARPSGYEAIHPVVADFIQATYFRAETGQLTLVGLIDPSEADAVVNPDNFKEQVDSDFVLDTGERLIRRFPPMELSQSTGGYASLYDITPDWHPIIDELPAGSGFYVCAGFSGHGFKLGPAVSLMLADLITQKSQPEFDPYLFRFSRYAENEPVRGQYEYSIAG